VFVLSSVTEGYSISLLEACAAALPIVATDVGGNREIVREGDNGFLVPPRLPEQFAEAMLKLVRDQTLRIQIGTRNRRFAEEGGSVRAMAERYDALYGCGTLPGVRRARAAGAA
jgi:glycosyltransferase involved in cell wall biosynthesis